MQPTTSLFRFSVSQAETDALTGASRISCQKRALDKTPACAGSGSGSESPLSEEECSNRLPLKKFRELPAHEKNLVREIHTVVELSYARVAACAVTNFSHMPFVEGYDLIQYLNDTQYAVRKWTRFSPYLPKIEIFLTIIRRSYFCMKEFPSHQNSVQKVLQTMDPGKEVWLGILSNCGSPDSRHWMVLHIKKNPWKSFNISLINVGYKCIEDSEARGYCRDFTLRNISNNRFFFNVLKEVLKVRDDVPEYYSLLTTLGQEKVSYGKRRPIMNIPLCATETLRQCYKDFLGEASFGRLMAFWSRQGLEKITALYKTASSFRKKPLHLHETPRHLTVYPWNEYAREPATVKFLSQSALEGFITTLKEAYQDYLKLSDDTRSESHPLTTTRKTPLKHNESDDFLFFQDI